MKDEKYYDIELFKNSDILKRKNIWLEELMEANKDIILRCLGINIENIEKKTYDIRKNKDYLKEI